MNWLKRGTGVAAMGLAFGTLASGAAADPISVSALGDYEYWYNSWNNTSSVTSSAAYENDFDRPGGWVWENDGSHSYLYPTSWSTETAADPTGENFSIEFELDEGLSVEEASVSYNMLLSSATHTHMRLVLGVGVFDEQGNENVTRVDEAFRTSGASAFVSETSDITSLLEGEDRFIVYGWRETMTSDTSVTQRNGHQFFRQSSGDNPSFEVNLTTIPEPGSLALLSAGALCLFRRRR